MIALVDIYAKLIIAVFGFIAPTITLLLPILEKRIQGISSLLQIQENTLIQIREGLATKYKDSFGEIPDEKLRARLIKELEKYNKKGLKEFNKIIIDTKDNLKYLNLKLQIKKIFGLLLISLFFVMLYHLAKVNLYGVFGKDGQKKLLSGLFLLLCSSLSFAWSLYTLWRIFCVMLHDVDKENEQIGGNNIGMENGNTNNSKAKNDVQVN